MKRVRDVVTEYRLREETLIEPKWTVKFWKGFWNAGNASDVDNTKGRGVHPPAKFAGVGVRKLYIMTNGDRAWAAQLKQALEEDARRSWGYGKAGRVYGQPGPHSTEDQEEWDIVHSWDSVATSRDLELGWEEKFIVQAMDMLVATRAELFIGNGVS